MGKLIEAAALKHEDWISIVQSFGCSIELAEDIVQEMYILLIGYEADGLNIWYNETEINYFYIYKMLKGLHIGFIRKESKIKKIDINDIDLSDEDPDWNEFEKDFENKLKAYEQAMDDIYWYDKKVFELVATQNNISELSRKTKISYDSLRNTFIVTKNKLKNKLL